MADAKLYGLSNCDTVRRARGWLGERAVAFTFHDFRRDGLDPALLADWIDRLGWEALVNRSGTTFRSLPEAEKADLSRERATALMLAQPAMIRRPVLASGNALLVGFKPETWAAALDRERRQD